MRDWVTNVRDTYYLLGSVLGPHPYPLMVRDFQSVIGSEARAQCLEAARPAARRRSSRASAAAATRWASSTPSSTTPSVRLIGVEAGGRGIAPGEHAARFAGGSAGVLHGTRSYVLQDADGNVEPHALDLGRPRLRGGRTGARLAARRVAAPSTRWIDDDAALAAFQRLGREEGILPALESSHAVAHAIRLAPTMAKDGRFCSSTCPAGATRTC